MENKLIINNDDFVFKLVCKDKNKLTETIVFGDENNRLEVNVYNGSYQISSMECIYLDNIVVDKYYLPDYTQINGIKEFHDISCYYEEDSFRDFELNLNNNNQLDILLNENLDPTHYYVDGRIEYYYDDNMLLLYVKIKDLTPEEYNYFKNIHSSLNITK